MVRGHITVSVIVPAYNAEDTIGAQLRALAGQDCEESYEVLVCDNGSTDRTRSVVLSMMGAVPHLRLVDASGRRGPAHARNVGIREARGRILAMCDADDVVERAWLRVLTSAVEKGLVVTGWTDRAMLNDPSSYSGDPIARDLVIRCGYAPGVETNNVALLRDDALKLRGFDESYSYCEDIDFAWRAHGMGLEVVMVPALVHYRLRRSMMELYAQHRNWALWSMMLKIRYRDVIPPSYSLKYTVVEFARRVAGFLPKLLRCRTQYARREETRKLANAVGEFQGMMRFRVLGRPPAADFSTLGGC